MKLVKRRDRKVDFRRCGGIGRTRAFESSSRLRDYGIPTFHLTDEELREDVERA